MALTPTSPHDDANSTKLVQLSTYISPELKREISIKAAESGTQPSKLIAKLLEREFPVRKSILNCGHQAEA